MSLQAAMLRAVNVGGRKLVMAELRAACEAAGFGDVRTLLASGNLVLDAKEKGAALESSLEAALAKRLKFKTDIFVRDAKECAAILDANPFPAMAKNDPSHLVVYFMRAKPAAGEKQALEAPHAGPEQLRVLGRELYITYPDGIGRSKFKFKAFGKARNWNTVTKLAAMTRAT
jgi:uncharacterized protein (DUF1697 family)